MHKYHHLTQDERYTIALCKREGLSQAEIGRRLGRNPSTISRELRINQTRHDGCYRPEKAQSYAQARRKRSRRTSHFSQSQWQEVERRLGLEWSPEQISVTLREAGILRISHETIYRYILKDKKAGGLLYKSLRIMPKQRRKRYNSKDSRGILPGKRHISERPAVVETREEFGHWEGDTVIGQDKHHCILTLVERKSGLCIIKKCRARTAAQITAAAIQAILEHEKPFKTITFDNGTEFHDYKRLEERFGLTCYFATPYHSWERGSNENLNGLIRQYIPKGSCMSSTTQDDCDLIAHKLNTRPRKRLNFKTPKEVYYAS